VRAVTRAGTTFLGSVGFRGIRGISIGTTQTATGKQLSVNTLGVDFDLFDFYGVAPLAGTLPKADGTPLPRNQDFVVLNETAVRKFELGTPKEAIGKSVATGAPGRPNTIENGSTVLAVVPDLSLSPVQENVPPTAYYQLGPQDGDLINVRLSGHDVPETLAAIDAAWLDLDDNRKLGMHGPVRFFLDEHVQHHYVSVLRQSQAFGICALIAIALGCVGLYALTAASAARRTREIGLRKALGAQTTAIARLLLWQFTRPVVWGVLIAWPVAAGLMHRWLEGFAYHADLPLWLFPAAAFAALLIAAATVTAHTVLVARTPPATALRCE
jgi:putative ABC transport system permease protein